MLHFCKSHILKMAKTIAYYSIGWSVKQRRFSVLIDRLRVIEPDLSEQYSRAIEGYDKYVEMKMRSQHAFQCSLILKEIERKKGNDAITIVDIGDSAGTHMNYIDHIVADDWNKKINTISVNLDPVAIDKIKAKGRQALLCRAEEYEPASGIDLFTSLEMLEHLHNPAIFLKNLAKKSSCNRLIITVPYRKTSRVGLYTIRRRQQTPVNAENDHIFELSPGDWKLLMLHSGWESDYDEIYYQYPRGIPVISNLLALFWRRFDFEGFWGVILKKDTFYCDLYQDWES